MGTLNDLAAEAAGCQDCDLWEHATQTVFGAGPPSAPLVLVGEQPGDQEDRAGTPFIGPAGRLLRDAVDDAGLTYEDLYVTNAVKHFKWKPRGKRRIHDKPNRGEVVACKQWLEAELDTVDPDVVVALGATAGQSLFGSGFRVGAAKGAVLDLDGTPVIATAHPSSVLRMRGEDREDAYRVLVEDLSRAGTLLTD